MEAFLQSLMTDDRPLTIGILLYIVYMLHKSDQKQNRAIKWLKRTITSLMSRVDNLEKFNQRVHPNEWRQPPNMPHIPLDDDDDDDTDTDYL